VEEKRFRTTVLDFYVPSLSLCCWKTWCQIEKINIIGKNVSKTFFMISIIIAWASSFSPLLGRTRSWGRCWAADRLSHLSELSGRAVHGEVEGLDMGGQHGRLFVRLRNTFYDVRSELKKLIGEKTNDEKWKLFWIQTNVLNPLSWIHFSAASSP